MSNLEQLAQACVNRLQAIRGGGAHMSELIAAVDAMGAEPRESAEDKEAADDVAKILNASNFHAEDLRLRQFFGHVSDIIAKWRDRLAEARAGK